MTKLFITQSEFDNWFSSLRKDGEPVLRVSSGEIQVIVKRFDGWEDTYSVRIKELEKKRFIDTWGQWDDV